MHIPPSIDKDIRDRLREGDTDVAFNLLNPYSNAEIRALQRRIALQDAEDVLQEVLQALWATLVLQTFDLNRPLSPYLNALIRNKKSNLFRAKRPTSVLCDTELTESMQRKGIGDNTAEAPAELRGAIASAIAELPKEEQIVVSAMLWIEEWQATDDLVIAIEEMHQVTLSKKTIQRRITTAKERLESLLPPSMQAAWHSARRASANASAKVRSPRCASPRGASTKLRLNKSIQVPETTTPEGKTPPVRLQSALFQWRASRLNDLLNEARLTATEQIWLDRAIDWAFRLSPQERNGLQIQELVLNRAVSGLSVK